MLIICDSSFWHCTDKALGKCSVFSPTLKFVTKTREIKECFLKPEVRWGHRCPIELRELHGAYLDSNTERGITPVCHRIVL